MIKLTKNIDRFWSKVEKTETCWNWIGSKTKAGYGQFYHKETGKGVVYYAHRISEELARGPIPKGTHVDHRCHNVACVRPSHIRVVTVSQNAENRRGAASNNRSSGIRGVTWDKARGKWNTQVGRLGRVYSAGRFDDLEEAAQAVKDLRNRIFTHNEADRAA